MVLSSDCFAQEDNMNFSGGMVKVEYPSDPLPCKDSLTNYTFNCLGNDLNIHIPCNYLRTDFFQYTEGRILTIHYPDSSTISILCGTEANINLPGDNTKGYYFKKVVVKDYQIAYENVPGQKLRLFNKAFDLLNEDIK